MDEPKLDQKENIKDIAFPNGNLAHLVKVSAEISADLILKTLHIEQPKALVMIFGGADELDESLKPRLAQLLSRGIIRATAKTGALIIDGGTQAGVMELTGKSVADRDRKSILVGVAPAGKVTYPDMPAEETVKDGVPLDPNHSHFVLVDCSEWGCEIKIMFELAKALAKGIPIVTILVNGGQNSKYEVLQSVRQGWPVIIIEKTGRLADEIAGLWKKKQKKKKGASFIKDSAMAEIIADGNIQLFPLDGSVEMLERLVLRKLPVNVNPTLKLAWERFALYDFNAISQQNSFNRMQKWVLALGVLATVLALSHTQFKEILSPLQNRSLEVAILITPITISILIAATNRFKSGNKWVLLRAGAEAIKREIYRFRARAETYSSQQTADTSGEAKLACEVENICRQLMQTEVNLSALRPYEGPIPPDMYGAAAADDGYSDLSPDSYLKIRLGDQLNYYQKKTAKLERQLKRLQWSIYIFGGIGTFLAAVGLQLWIALTTALVGTIATFLEYQQVENTLMKYNQAATNLANVKAWWTALTTEKKADPNNVDRLVGNTEKILQSELTGWVRQMEDALEGLRAQQTKE